MLHKDSYLLCFGERDEIPRLFKHTIACSNTQMRAVWWCKSDAAEKSLACYLKGSSKAVSKVKAVRCIKKLPPFPFPEEWVRFTLRYTCAADPNKKTKFLQTNYAFASALLCEAFVTLSLLRPNALLIKAGTRPQEACFLRLAQEFGIPYLLTERGMFPQTMLLDPKDVGPGLLRTESSIAVNAMGTESYLQSYRRSSQSAWEQPEEVGKVALEKRFGISKGEKTFFYVGQVEDDANMKMYSPRFSSNKAFLDFIIATLTDMPASTLIIKPHPKEQQNFVALPKQVGSVRLIVDRNIHIKDAFSLASAVISVNSTVGFEALVFGLPVIVGGSAHYSERGLTFDVLAHSQQELACFFACPFVSPEQDLARRKYIQRFFNEATYFIEPTQNGNGPIEYVNMLKNYAKAFNMKVSYDLLGAADEYLNQYKSQMLIWQQLTRPYLISTLLKARRHWQRR